MLYRPPIPTLIVRGISFWAKGAAAPSSRRRTAAAASPSRPPRTGIGVRATRFASRLTRCGSKYPQDTALCTCLLPYVGLGTRTCCRSSQRSCFVQQPATDPQTHDQRRSLQVSRRHARHARQRTRGHDDYAATRGVVLANALWDLHQCGRMHRDVKSHNFFLCTVHGIKLGDLGKMCAWNESLTTNAGTPKWRAPEVGVSGSNYDYAAEVYSFGVVLGKLCVLVSDATDAPWQAPMATMSKRETPTNRPTSIAIVERLGYNVHRIPVPSGLEAHLLSCR